MNTPKGVEQDDLNAQYARTIFPGLFKIGDWECGPLTVGKQLLLIRQFPQHNMKSIATTVPEIAAYIWVIIQEDHEIAHKNIGTPQYDEWISAAVKTVKKDHSRFLRDLMSYWTHTFGSVVPVLEITGSSLPDGARVKQKSANHPGIMAMVRALCEGYNMTPKEVFHTPCGEALTHAVALSAENGGCTFYSPVFQERMRQFRKEQNG